MTAALKPCHNLLCRSTEIIIEDYQGWSPSYKAKIFYHCSCSRCGIEGPDGDTKEEAIRLWNLPIHPAEETLKKLVEVAEDISFYLYVNDIDYLYNKLDIAIGKAKKVLK